MLLHDVWLIFNHKKSLSCIFALIQTSQLIQSAVTDADWQDSVLRSMPWTHLAWWHRGSPVYESWPLLCWIWAGSPCGPAPCRPSAAAERWSDLQGRREEEERKKERGSREKQTQSEGGEFPCTSLPHRPSRPSVSLTSCSHRWSDDDSWAVWLHRTAKLYSTEPEQICLTLRVLWV